tara:strand:- start:282 stop:512 length:231 start_codon:yes stop_codon:yes gene_type:complete
MFEKKHLEDFPEYECLGGSLDGKTRRQAHENSFSNSDFSFAPVGKLETYELAEIDGTTYWVESELLIRLRNDTEQS